MTIEELKTYLDQLSKATYVRGVGYRVETPEGTKTFSLGDFSAEQERVKGLIEEQETAQRTAETQAAQRTMQIRRGQRTLRENDAELIRRYTGAVTRLGELTASFARGATQVEPDIVKAEQMIATAEAALNRVGFTVPEDGSIVRQTSEGVREVVAGPPASVTGGAVTENVRTAATTAAGLGEMPQRGITRQDQAPAGGEGAAAPTPTGVTPARTDVNTWIDTQLELQNLPDTKANRNKLRAEYKNAKMQLPADWKEKFAARYPGLEYMLNENIFGPEVTAIIQRAVSEQWFRFPQTATALIQREIANTPYGMQATVNQENFDKKSSADQLAAVQKRVADLQKSYGILGLSDADWQRLGYIAERNGEDDLLTQQKLFQTIYEKTPEGNRRYDTAVRMVENGRLGQEVNKEFAKYLLKAPDDAIEMYATGQTTLENIRQQSRAAAKYMFPALADLIDQGVDVKFIADQYAATAADVLDVAPGSIDMSDPKYRVALDVRDGANSRTMTLGEWQAMLKTDPNYGWQYTKQANQQAMDISTTIARVFGKIQ